MEQLTRFGDMAKESWKECRPKMYASLVKKGILKTALYHNQQMAKQELAARVRSGELFSQAQEAVLATWILLPEEPTPLTPDQMPFLQCAP
jgi:hypothetical protein